jgi:hypothetical protein
MASQKSGGSPGMCEWQHFFGAPFFCYFSLEKQRKVNKHHHLLMPDQTFRRRRIQITGPRKKARWQKTSLSNKNTFEGKPSSFKQNKISNEFLFLTPYREPTPP